MSYSFMYVIIFVQRRKDDLLKMSLQFLFDEKPICHQWTCKKFVGKQLLLSSLLLLLFSLLLLLLLLLLFRHFCYKIKLHLILFNSLGPSEVIHRDRSGSTLAQVMACFLAAPSHYLNQLWLIVKGDAWHSAESNWEAILYVWNCILTHWGLDKMAAIFLTTIWNAFSWKKMYDFRLRFHWNVFGRFELTISHHWFR